ncbi:MAG: hypothetical protein R6T85_09720 [Egibacteraceae bacterium]
MRGGVASTPAQGVGQVVGPQPSQEAMMQRRGRRLTGVVLLTLVLGAGLVLPAVADEGDAPDRRARAYPAR